MYWSHENSITSAAKTEVKAAAALAEAGYDSRGKRDEFFHAHEDQSKFGLGNVTISLEVQGPFSEKSHWAAIVSLLSFLFSSTILVYSSGSAYLRWQAGLPEALSIIYDKHDGPKAGLSLGTNIKLPKLAYLKVGLSMMDSLLFFLLQILRGMTRIHFRQCCLPLDKRASKRYTILIKKGGHPHIH